MKRIYLQKIIQYGSESYIGKIDPRELVRIATKIEMSTTQDAQRPLTESRVRSIANYVGEGGILPNTLTLATNDNKIDIHQLTEFPDFYYIEVPEHSDEFRNFANSIDVMDGQHRLYSFDEAIRILQDDVPYEIGFTLYIKPALSERRRIFISCNEKQEKVSGNLLMWFKSKLNMLSNDEKELYTLVSKLNNEYPLKGHIIMSAEKIKNGVKAKELMKVIDKAKIQNFAIGNNLLTETQKLTVICKYLSAWEKVVGFNFATSSANLSGAAVKIAGLRFMIAMLPAFWDRAILMQKQFTEEFCQDIIKKLISSCGVVREEFFTCDEHKMYFRERSSTQQFAEQCIVKIRAMGSEEFNPLM